MKTKSDNYMPNDPSRRDFFTKIVLTGIAASMPPFIIGCDNKSSYKGTGLVPYKVWEEILHYLKTSPDHLAARMGKFVEQKDPEAMFNFVRDEFFLMPTSEKAIGKVTISKWGIRYMLRSGVATAREKAELLNLMYQKAGIPSKIVTERTNFTPEEAKEFFLKPIEHKFSPEITNRMLKKWSGEMGKGTDINTFSNPYEDIVTMADELGGKIWNSLAIEDNYYYRPFDFRWDNYNTPTVAFEWQGETKYAHLFDDRVPFGELKTGNTSNIGSEQLGKPNEDKVTVKVAYRDAIKPNEEKELIYGEWLATDVVGRQISLQFLNNLTLEEQAVTPVIAVNNFTPALSFQAIDETETFMSERSVLSDPIMLSGKRIKINNDEISIGDNKLISNTNKHLQKEVESLYVDAKTITYPNVKLSVSPKNKLGEMVEGLSANAFTITENSKLVKTIMESNQRTPRVLIMGDISGSMPKAFADEGMKDLVAKLKSIILKKYPAAIVTYWGTPSSLFTWLLKASQTENDLIIYATDGDNDDTYDPVNEKIYQNGPPAIILDVKKSDFWLHKETFSKMAEVTSGLHIAVTNHEEAIKGINTYLEKIKVAPYIFTYSSLGKPDSIHKVKVEIDNKRLSESDTYEFNLIDKNSPIGPALIGLYLEVRHGKEKPLKRVLAGWDNVINPTKMLDQAMADEVHDFMFGSTQIYFEGSGPTYAAAMSDLLKVKLSTREWGEALLKEDMGNAKEAFKKGSLSISGQALELMAPLVNPVEESSFTFPSGLRIGISTVKPGFITDTTEVLFDYLPTSGFVTLSGNAKQSFKITLKKTAQLAIREHKLFSKSTYSELLKKEWISLIDAREKKWFEERRKNSSDRYWRERVDRNAKFKVFDKSAVSRSFWDINQDTGELYGILPNGYGGGKNPFKSDIDEITDIMAALSLLISIVAPIGKIPGLGGFSLGIVALYGVTLVKLYAIVSEAIIIMDTSGMDEKIRLALAEFACEVAKQIVYATNKGPGALMGGLDTLIGLVAGDKNPLSC